VLTSLGVYSLHQSQTAFRAALCDSFNTPEALNVLRELVSKTNIYMNARGPAKVNVDVIENNAKWVGQMLRMFGLGEGEREELGWGQERADDEANVNVSALHRPYTKDLNGRSFSARRF
jgi:cysteinyl-tRNA synthetase